MSGTLKKLVFADGVDITEPSDLSSGGGSGSGELNLISGSNSSAGWVASASGITVATSTTSTDLPLVGISTTSIKITPVSGTDYVYYRFTMAASLKQRKLKIQWEQRPLSGYASGDLKLELYINSASNYGGSYTRLSLSTDSGGVSAIPNLSGRYTSTFDGDSSDYYELRIKRVAGTTALNLANVIVGPGIQPQGAVITEAQSYTPTFSGLGTVTNIDMWWSRRGSKMVIWGTFKNGTVSASAAYFSLPSGFNINSSRHQTGRASFGQISQTNTSTTGTVIAGNIFGAYISGNGNGNISICSSRQANAGNVDFISENGNTVFSGSETLSVENLEIEISEWAGSGIVNLAQNDVEYKSVGGTWDADSSTTVSGPAGYATGGALTAARNKTITWDTPVLATERIYIWMSKDQVNWFLANGAQIGSGNSPVIPSVNAAGTVSSGVSFRPGASSNQTIVTFAQYASMANDDSPTVDWPSSASYWVATKSASGLPVGFSIVSESASGLMPANIANLDDVAATRMGLKTYYIGQTYNGGSGPGVSATGWSNSYGAFIPYQMQDGIWRLRINFTGSFTGQANTNATSLTAIGFTVASTRQCIAINDQNIQNGRAATASFNGGSSTLQILFSANISINVEYAFSGDIELASKPSWAY